MPDKQDQLLSLALSQGGYFTAKQAIACGFTQKNHCYYYRHGHWQRTSKGLYRLSQLPVTPASEWAKWLLWSRNNNEVIEGALCLESALALYGLRSQTEPVTHMLLPERLRKRGVESDLKTYPLLPNTPREDLLEEGWLRVANPNLAVKSTKKLLQNEGIYEQVAQRARELAAQLREGKLHLHDLCGLPAPQLVCPDKSQQAHRIVSAQGQQIDDDKNLEIAEDQSLMCWNLCPITSIRKEESLLGDNLSLHKAPQMTRTAPANAWPDPIFSGSQWRNWRMRNVARELTSARTTFTLVEMLVVICIIAVLAALLMPALNKALGSSRQIVCANNQKTIGIAHAQYQSDFNGFLAHCVYTDDGTIQDGAYYGWGIKISQYLGYPTLGFPNPGKPGQRGNVLTCGENPGGEFNGNFSSFAINGNLGALVSSICRYPAYKINKFVAPSGKLYIFDGGGYRTRDMDFSFTGGPGSNLIRPRHNDGMLTNVAFLDGHVKSYGGDILPYVYDGKGAYWLNPAYSVPSGL